MGDIILRTSKNKDVKAFILPTTNQARIPPLCVHNIQYRNSHRDSHYIRESQVKSVSVPLRGYFLVCSSHHPHLFSTALMKSVNSGNGVPFPQIPKRTMYAMFFGSEAPVAEAYTTRAFGSLVCSSSTVRPVFVGFPEPTGLKFLAR